MVKELDRFRRSLRLVQASIFPNFKIFRPGGSHLSAGHSPFLPGRCALRWF
jgi:hypothetical protein